MKRTTSNTVQWRVVQRLESLATAQDVAVIDGVIYAKHTGERSSEGASMIRPAIRPSCCWPTVIGARPEIGKSTAQSGYFRELCCQLEGADDISRSLYLAMITSPLAIFGHTQKTVLSLISLDEQAFRP